MSKARRIAFVILAAVSAASLFADTQPYPQSEFVANLSASLPDWRPHKAYNADEAQILSSVYEGLFVYDPYNLDPVPALAESWTVSKDGLLWTFKIRKNAKFENGDPITASVMRNSLIALLNPAIAAPYASLLDPVKGVASYRSGAETNPETVGIEAPDDATLIMRLDTPAEHLPKILCHHAFSAIHPSQIADALKDNLSPDYRPIASGAFSVKSVTPDAITLEKNAQYWDSANVALPSVKLILEDDGLDLTARYNRGEIQWLAGASIMNKVLGSAAIHVTPMFATEYFFFRSTWGLGADAKIRNALLLAVPWKQLRANFLIPAKTLIFPIANYPEIAGIDAEDSEAAKQKLLEAGITNPGALDPIVISVPDAESFTDLAKILQKAWQNLGFRVEIRALPYSVYYSTLRTDDYTVGVTSWIGDFADPLSFLEMFRPSSSLNDSGWRNPGFEACILQASAIKQVKDRYAKLAEAESILLADGVILPVAHNPALNVIDTDGIEGWYANALDIHPFKFIRFVQKKSQPGVALLAQ